MIISVEERYEHQLWKLRLDIKSMMKEFGVKLKMAHIMQLLKHLQLDELHNIICAFTVATNTNVELDESINKVS